MEEVNKRSRISEDSPPMTFPLVQDLEYLVINKAADDILLGKFQPNEFIDEYTQAYLNQLISVKGILLEDASPISFPTYINEVNNLHERHHLALRTLPLL
eukprot:5421538-Ditylum_brightwellii.AAC.1